MSVKATFNSKPALNSITERAKKKLIAVGFMIEREAKTLCPVDTGRLRASISTNWTDSGMLRGKTGTVVNANEYGGQLAAVESAADGVGAPSHAHEKFAVVVGTNVHYAPFIEFGTSKMGNTPFLRAAFEKHKNLIENK